MSLTPEEQVEMESLQAEQVGKRPEPDMTPVKNYVAQNMAAYNSSQSGSADAPQRVPEETPRHAESFYDSLQAGFQMSTMGLLERRKMPDIIPPEHADLAAKIALGAGGFMGDFPAMAVAGVAGSAFGGAAGTALAGPAGTAAGALAGSSMAAFAAPQGLRELYTQMIRDGSIDSWQDFWTRSMAVTWESMKGAATGAATTAAGPVAGQLGGPIAKGVAELATMTTVGSALEGHMPEPSDFVVNAMFLGGMHAGHVMGEKLPSAAQNILSKYHDIYAKTGLKPEEVTQMAQGDPVLKQEILSRSPEMPASIKEMAGPPPPFESARMESLKGTKVVDENGKPKVVYHGTNNVYETPSIDKAKNGLYGRGFYTTEDPEIASSYGSGVSQTTRRPMNDAEREQYFTPGKVVDGYGGKDRVLEYYPGDPSKPYPDDTWRVKVESVDKNGNATDRPRWHATNPEITEKSQPAANVRPIYLNIKNPINMDAPLTQETLVRLQRGLLAFGDKGLARHLEGLVGEKVSDALEEIGYLHGGSTDEQFTQMLKDSGYDGITHTGGILGGKKHTVWIALDDKQIISRFGNEIPAGYIPAKVSSELLEQHPALGDGFVPEEKPLVSEKAKEPTEPPEPRDPSDPNSAILDRIKDVTSPKKSSFSDIRQKAVDHRDYVDRLADVFRGERDLPVEQDPYKMLRVSAGSIDSASDMIDNGPRDWATQKPTGTPGLKQILRPYKNTRELVSYLTSAHILDLEKQGIEHGFDAEKAQQVVDAGKAKYSEVAKQIVQWQNDVLKYFTDSGCLSKAIYKESVEKYPNYVPMNRFLDDDMTGKKSGSFRKPIKKIEGSDLPVVDPFYSMVRKAYAMTREAELNRAMQTMEGLSKERPDLVDKLGTSEKEPSEKDIENTLIKKDIPANDPVERSHWKGMSSQLGRDEVGAMFDGKLQKYRVGEDVAKAINADPFNPGVPVKIASIAAKVARGMMVENPAFIAKHAFRDLFGSFANSDNGFIPAWDNAIGFTHALAHLFGKDTETYRDWIAHGGGMGQIVSGDIDYIKNKSWELSRETGTMAKTWNVISSPFRFLQASTDAVFKAPKIGEYRRAILNGKTGYDAAYASREVTPDFALHGSDPMVRSMSIMAPFWKAEIVGNDNFFRHMKDDPVRTTTKYAVGIGLASIAAWWANKDDSRYQDASTYEKTHFWILPTNKWEPASQEDAMLRQPDQRIQDGNQWYVNNGTVYRLPKPFLAGQLFGSLPEKTLDAFYRQNPDAFKDFAKELALTAVPVPGITALTAIEEHRTNHNNFTGGPLISDEMKKIAPQYQYKSYTSGAAKALGSIISYIPSLKDAGPGNATLASPMVIEHYVRSFAGDQGMYAINLLSAGLEKAGVLPPSPPTADWKMSDIPYVKSFVLAHPSFGEQPLHDFRETYGQAKTVQATIRHLVGIGDGESLSKYLSNPDTQEHMVAMDGIAKGLATMSHAVELINVNPDYTPNDKTQQIQRLYYGAIMAAKSTNEGLAKARDELKKDADRIAKERGK